MSFSQLMQRADERERRHRKEFERLLNHRGRLLLHRQAVVSGREDAAIATLAAALEPPGSDEFSADEWLSCDSNGGA